MENLEMNVAIIGASPKEDRYSYKALKMLTAHGHKPLPVNPGHATIAGVAAYKTMSELPPDVDVVTMYVSPEHSTSFAPQIADLKPRCVIFNPGSENPALQRELSKLGIHWIEACTLVLLQTGQFTKATQGSGD
jgi:predicted CoA-binding protein